MATWPTILPCQPVLGTFNMQPEDNVDEFQPQFGGTTLRRQRYTGRTFIYVGELFLKTLFLMEVLDDFHHDDCLDGALSFEMQDWRDHVTRTFNWVQAPTYQRGAQGTWRAGITLRREPT